MDGQAEFTIPFEELERVEVKGTRFGLRKKNNMFLPQVVRNTQVLKTAKIREDDLFVIGFPKSGTTWVEEISYLLKNDLNFELAQSVPYVKRIFYFDRGLPDMVLDNLPSPRIFKSHLTLDFLPENLDTTAKVVYVARNPKDVAVSAYNFFKSIIEDEITGTFQEYYESFLEGKVTYGPWWTHIDSYLNNPNVHVIFYETLLQEPLETIRSLAKFLGKEYTDDQLRQVIDYTSFDNMKTKGQKTYDVLIAMKFVKEDINFFRKGKAGSWRDHFTPEMSENFDKVIAEKLQYKGTFNYGPE